MKGIPTVTHAQIARPALAAAALAVSTVFCAGAYAQASAPAQTRQEVRYARNLLLVSPKAGLSDRQIDKALGKHRGRRAVHWRQLGVHFVEVPEGVDVLQAAAELARDPNFKFVTADIQRKLEMLPNDPNVGSSWHIGKLNAPTAWDRTQGEGITMAVCDTGVDATHPDLVRVPGYNMYDGTTDSRDVHGHGTKVAGSVAMSGNNGLGGAGVAFRTKIMPIRVSDANGWAYDSAIANCITYAADMGARGANVSYAVCGSPVVQAAAKYMRDRGGVVTVSSGNGGTELTTAASDVLTCVGATDGNDNKTSWSSYGQFVDVVAPGDNIYTTTNGSSYGGASGTSFSAPVTLGVYALMMAANPALTPTQLDSILFSTARDLGTAGKDNTHGYGRIDAAAAVAKAAGMGQTDLTPPSVAIKSPIPGSKVSGIVPVDVAATDAGGVNKVELYLNGKLLSTDTISPYGFSIDTSGIADGTATLVAKAVDASGNVGSSTSVSITVSNDRTPPTPTILSPGAGTTVSGTVTVSASATDNTKVAKITLTIDGREVAVSYGSSISYPWNTGATAVRGRLRKTSGATSTIQVVAEDAAGNKGTVSETVRKP